MWLPFKFEISFNTEKSYLYWIFKIFHSLTDILTSVIKNKHKNSCKTEKWKCDHILSTREKKCFLASSKL